MLSVIGGGFTTLPRHIDLTDELFLQSLGLILIAAAVFAAFSRLARLPLIVGYILAGLALGPLTGLVTGSEALEMIAEAGIVLLLFLVGLELSVPRLKSVGGRSALVGVVQIALTLPAAFALASALGFAATQAAVLAVGLTLSSTVVVIKGLVEKRQTQTLSGQTAIAVLLIQDMFVIVLLTIIAGLGAGAGAEAPTPAAVAKGAGKALASMGLILVLISLLARFVLPRPFDWARRSRETVFIASVAWCFAVVLAVHALHLSAEIGAFLAGVSLAQLPHAHDLQRRVTPLMNCFVAVFFVTLGAGLSFENADTRFWTQAIVLSLFVIIAKFVIVALITRALGYAQRPAFDTALLLTQISEFSFIFAAAAAAAGLASTGDQSLLAAVGLITITASSILPMASDSLFGLYRKSPLAPRGGGRPSPDDDSVGAVEDKGHVIVVGMNTLGKELVRRLHAEGTSVIAIDTDPRKLHGLPCKAMEGDAATPAVLAEAGLDSAGLLVSTLHIPDTNELLAYRARAAGVACAVHAPNILNTAPLLELDVRYLMTPKVDSLKVQAATLSDLGLLEPNP